MSADPDKHIPTLTDIIEPGDNDMLHHFDTGAFAEAPAPPRYQMLDENELRNTIEMLVDEVVDDLIPALKQQLAEKLLAELNPPPESD